MNKVILLLLSCIIVQGSVNAMEHTYPLHDAAADGDVEHVQALLDTGADVNERDTEGNMPLHWAVTRHPTCIFKTSSPDWTHRIGLFIACQRVAVARLLIKCGAYVNAQNNYGDTPLLVSTHDGMRLLLDNGTDINLKNKDGITPLHIAAQNGDEGNLRTLLEHGAKTTLPWDMHCMLGYTPEYFAAQNGHPEIAGLLKVWPTVASNSKARMLTFCMAMHDRVGADSPGNLLSQYLFQEICSYLKPEAITLRIAVIIQDIEAITALLNAGADVNTQEYDLPLLHVAITYRNIDIIKLLLAHGADVNYENRQGKTAFDLAHKDLAITELLRNYPVTKHQKQTQSGCIIS